MQSIPIQAWMGIASIAAAVLLVVVAFVAYKAWMFAKWMRAEVRSAVEEVQNDSEYHSRVHSLMKPEVARIASECVKVHNEALEAHPIKWRSNDAFIRTFVVEQLEKHNDNKVAHHVALAEYVGRREFQGAIERLEERIENNTQRIITELRHKRQDEDD